MQALFKKKTGEKQAEMPRWTQTLKLLIQKCLLLSDVICYFAIIDVNSHNAETFFICRNK